LLQTKIFSSLSQTARLPFLILAPIVIFLTTTILIQTSDLDWINLALVIFGAIAAHISVNMLNEYHDFHSGLDFLTTRTPFSGGSGALPQTPNAAPWVLVGGVLMLVLACGIGGWLMVAVSWWLLLPGVLGVGLVVAYSTILTRYPLLCLISPGLGFGPMIMGGCAIALSDSVSTSLLWVSLLPFFLVNNLLLLNQIPDCDADRQVGRRTFPLVYGVQHTFMLFFSCSIAAMLILGGGVLLGFIPVGGLLGLVGFLWLTPIFRQRHVRPTPDRLLAQNVAMTLSVPALTGIGVLWF
jgi:1,4-dihydroxy-2-naphthoate polyprenyltransferase